MGWLDLEYALPIGAGLVILAGLFAGTEVAVFSLRRVDRDQMARSGRSADKSVLALLAAPRRLITAVLIGIESIIATLVVLILGIVALASRAATSMDKGRLITLAQKWLMLADKVGGNAPAGVRSSWEASQ